MTNDVNLVFCLYIFFGEMCMHFFFSIAKLDFLKMLNFESALYVLNTSLLPDM